MADALEALSRGEAPSHGAVYRDGARWVETAPGKVLSPEEWAFPDLSALSPEIYSFWRKQRGKEADDLSFLVSRGCPINCARWCPTPLKEGLRDRRRSARACVEYMETIPAPSFKVVDLMNPYAEERLVAELAEVGMSAVGFGVETLSASGRRLTPKVEVAQLAKVALSYGEFYSIISDPAGFIKGQREAGEWAA